MLNFDSLTKDPALPNKILIGSLLALTGFGMVPVLGWTLEILRRNVREEAPEWPGWENLGAFTLEGFKGLVLVFLWMLPVALLVIGFSLTGVFLPDYFAAENDALLSVLLLNLCGIVGMVLYMLPVAFLSIPALGILATESFQQALNPLNAWRILKANMSGFLLAGALGTGTSVALGSIGSFLCLVGTFPAFVLSYGLLGQYYGIAYREALEKLT